MVEKFFTGLRPVGGFSEVARRELPDLRLEDDDDVTIARNFEANIFVRFRAKHHIIEGLTHVLAEKLHGREPTFSVDGDSANGYFVLVGFRVAGDDEVTTRIVQSFKAQLEASIRGVTEVLDAHADIYDLSQ